VIYDGFDQSRGHYNVTSEWDVKPYSLHFT